MGAKAAVSDIQQLGVSVKNEPKEFEAVVDVDIMLDVNNIEGIDDIESALVLKDYGLKVQVLDAEHGAVYVNIFGNRNELEEWCREYYASGDPEEDAEIQASITDYADYYAEVGPDQVQESKRVREASLGWEDFASLRDEIYNIVERRWGRLAAESIIDQVEDALQHAVEYTNI
jgi:hypothetical protein